MTEKLNKTGKRKIGEVFITCPKCHNLVKAELYEEAGNFTYIAQCTRCGQKVVGSKNIERYYAQLKCLPIAEK